MLGTRNRGRNQNGNRIQNGMHVLGFEIVELEIEGYLWEVACRSRTRKISAQDSQTSIRFWSSRGDDEDPSN